MNDLGQRIARLSPEKRALLVQRLAPLSFAQQRIWMLEQSQPGSLFYKTEVSLHLNGELNIRALEQSLTEVFRRHESLRTVFPVIDGQPLQMVTPAQPLHLPVIDLTHLPGETQEAETQRMIGSLNREVFDLEQGPLWRMRLVKLSEEKHVMVLVVHHLMFDGWSRGVLTREVAVLYSAYLKGEPSPLQELPMQYGAYSRRQRESLSGEVLDQQVRYWLEQLEGELPELELPCDHPRPAVTTHRGAVQTLEISKDVAQQVKALSRREGVTSFMTLLAAFQALIYGYTREPDFIVGTPVSGRHRAGTPALVGCFVNIITVRARLVGNPTFRTLLAQTRKLTVEAFANQDLPFASLLENLWPGQPLGSYGIRNGRKLFRVMLDYALVGPRKPGPTSSSLQISAPEVGETLTGLDFYIAVAESEDGLFGTVTCSLDLFDEDTITGMRKDYERVLERCVENPDEEILNIPLSLARTLPLGQSALSNQIEGGQL